MVKIEPFQVEEWMDKYETSATYNIAETCAASISISDLLALSEQPDIPTPIPTNTKLTYGSIRGSDALRNNIAGLYSARASSPLTKENILITPGAISANFLILYTLLSPGDHVICHYPTYSQLYQVPRSLGASVSLWKADPTQKWQLNTSTLTSLIRPGTTKLLILNSPNNPTGSVIPKSTLEEIISIAADHSITILSDEVYRPLFHSLSPGDPSFPPSALNIHPSTPTTNPPNVVVTSSMSKSYSLAGLRIGWIATRSGPLLNSLASSRHYTTISVSSLDDSVATTALSDHCVHALLGRNITLARTNLDLLAAFVEEHRWACDWVRPVAGTTAFVRFRRRGTPVDDAVLCERLVMGRWGVLVVPGGRCFGDADGGGGGGGGGMEGDLAGYVRVGFVNSTEIVREALAELKRFMLEEFENVPLAGGK